MASSGSTEVVAVVPTVATMAIGRWPNRTSSSIAAARASGRRRKSSSTAIARTPSRPRPSMMAAFSTEECACSEV